MAGAGYKLFNTGDVLTAAQVNTYLMEQTVMVFANAAARTTALSGVVSEGMISYLKDTNAVEVYDGSNWVSSDDPNAIQNTIVDAKGDLIAATGNDVPARLAVGNNGETLVADSSATTGLRWQGNFAAGKNKFINGDFQIWQRGTSSSAGGYLADRWTLNATTITTFSQSQQTFTPGTAPVAGYEGQYFYRGVVTTVGSATEWYLRQNVEDVRTCAGQTVTISFWAKADTARNVTIGYSRNFGSGGSAGDSADLGTKAITTSWARYSVTGTLPSVSGKTIGASSFLQIYFFVPPASGMTIDFWGMQMEIGNTATAFQTATGTLAGELGLCQRYYAKSYSSTVAPATTSALGSIVFMALVAYSSNNLRTPIRFPVAMRTAPTITLYSTNSGATGKWYNEGTATDVDAVAHQIGENGFITYQSAGTSNASNVLLFHYVASAEL